MSDDTTGQAQVDGIDAEAVGRWITGLGIGARGPFTFRRIGLGQSNLTFLVDDAAGQRYALRRPPLGEILASAHDVAREYRIVDALQATAVPVPVTYGLSEDPAVADVPLMLMSFVDGLVLGERADAEPLSPEVRHAAGLSMVDTLARIHAVDLDAAGLSDLASHKPYAPRQLRRWSAQWEHSRTRELTELVSLTARLEEALPEPGQITLVHGDCHLGNVLLDPTDGHALAVLDWELATLGDPLADLGTLLAYWPQSNDPATMRFDITTLQGFPQRSELVAEYARLTGRDVSAVPFWNALGVWKIAIIIEGVRRRQRDDPRNLSAHGHFPAEAVDGLVAYAHGVLDERY